MAGIFDPGPRQRCQRPRHGDVGVGDVARLCLVGDGGLDDSGVAEITFTGDLDAQAAALLLVDDRFPGLLGHTARLAG